MRVVIFPIVLSAYASLLVAQDNRAVKVWDDAATLAQVTAATRDTRLVVLERQLASLPYRFDDPERYAQMWLVGFWSYTRKGLTMTRPLSAANRNTYSWRLRIPIGFLFASNWISSNAFVRISRS